MNPDFFHLKLSLWCIFVRVKNCLSSIFIEIKRYMYWHFLSIWILKRMFHILFIYILQNIQAFQTERDAVNNKCEDYARITIVRKMDFICMQNT